VKINIFNHQKSLRLSKKLIKDQISLVLLEEDIHCDELNIFFVSKKDICDLHEKYLNDPSPTDCISFPIDDPFSKETYKHLGEVFVCTDIAIEYAKENNLSPYDEATLYMIHGILHLIGYDDILQKDIKTIRKKEKKYMTLLKEQLKGISQKHINSWKKEGHVD
jgi:probable rRNA maturation factor